LPQLVAEILFERGLAFDQDLGDVDLRQQVQRQRWPSRQKLEICRIAGPDSGRGA
jgi:hypothetical protein